MEIMLPIPCPSRSVIDFRAYFVGAETDRWAVGDEGTIRYCTLDEVEYLQRAKKHDHIPPWEKTHVFSVNGLAQLALTQSVAEESKCLARSHLSLQPRINMRITGISEETNVSTHD